MIRLLAAPGYDCFGVGDDDQVIYGYSGATPEFLIGFPTLLPRCRPSSRSRSTTAARPRWSARPATSSPTTTAVSPRPSGRPRAGATGRPWPPAHWPGRVRWPSGPPPATAWPPLAVDIITGWRDAGIGPGDIAVLARVNSALLPVQVACSEAGIPCTTPLGAKALGRTGMRTAFAYLRIGSDPGSHPQGGRAGHRPPALPRASPPWWWTC